MDHFTLALMTGAVAGALDIIPMIAQKLSFRSCLSAFLQYFFAGPIVTPHAMRLRKILLNETDRKRASK